MQPQRLGVWRSALMLSLVASVAAQDSTSINAATTSAPSPTVAPTASASANSSTATHTTQTISVGFDGFTFVQQQTLAHPGDTIVFAFFPKNHSVVRAEFGYPCVPYEDTGANKTGFFSGFQTPDSILTNPPTFSLLINDSEPIFFYDSVPNNCIQYGMVGVINPNASYTFDRQQFLAKTSTLLLQPGEPWPSDSGPDPFANATGAPTGNSSGTASGANSTTSTTTSHHHSGLAGGAIAGIVIGVLVALAVVALLFFLCGRNKTLSEKVEQHERVERAYGEGGIASVLSGSMVSSQPKNISTMPMTQSGHTSPRLAHYPGPYSDDASARGTGVMSPTSQEGGRSPSPTHSSVPAYNALPPELPHDPPTGKIPQEVPELEGEYFPKDAGSPKKSPGAEHYA